MSNSKREDEQSISLGFARRVRMRLPAGAVRRGWDCRSLGFGRIIAPALPMSLEIASDVVLNLRSGELRAKLLNSNATRSAA